MLLTRVPRSAIDYSSSERNNDNANHFKVHISRIDFSVTLSPAVCTKVNANLRRLLNITCLPNYSFVYAVVQ